MRTCVATCAMPLLSVTVNPVPEPQTWALWAAGTATVVARVARRRNA